MNYIGRIASVRIVGKVIDQGAGCILLSVDGQRFWIDLPDKSLKVAIHKPTKKRKKK
jgi:hypothetical protein